MSRVNSTNAFIDKACQTHGDRYSYEHANYIGSTINITITCRTHGDFQLSPKQHYAGSGCPTCCRLANKQGISRRLGVNTFIEKAIKVHGTKFNYSNVIYVNNSTKVSIICPIHGSFDQTPSDHLTGYGCFACAKDLRRMSLEEFISRASQVHGDRYDYSDAAYVNTSTKLTIKCRSHGPFLQTPNGHLYGKGCPLCKRSRGENKIYTWLKNHSITDFTAEKTFPDCTSLSNKRLRFDFFVPSHRLLIEFDGPQHFSPAAFGRSMSVEDQQKNYNSTVLHDRIKTEYAVDNNYELLRIRYDQNVYEVLSNYFDSSPSNLHISR